MFLSMPLQAQQTMRFGQGATYADIIKNDHRQFEQLLAQMRQSTDQQEKEDLLKQLKDGLGKHMDAEEKYLYPELEKDPASKMLAVKARDEHSAAKIQLKKVNTRAENDEYLARVSVLNDLIKNHATFEENQLLPAAQNIVDEASLTEQFRSAYR